METLTGCVYCDEGEDVAPCCSRHVRLVCTKCRAESAGYRRDHAEAA